jgi:addiction module HigA family antidote
MDAIVTPAARKTEASVTDARKRTMQAKRPTALPALAKRVSQRPVSQRAPVHPGYFLETRFLKPLHITQQALAHALGISRRRVNELIRGHRGISADTAVRLAIFFSNDASFWMQLQTDWDLHLAAKRLKV